MEDEELNVVDTTTDEKDETQTSEQTEVVNEAENKSDKVEFTEAQKTILIIKVKNTKKVLFLNISLGKII